MTGALAVHHFFDEGHATSHLPRIVVLGNTITFFAIILPAWGAAVHAIMNQLEFERIATRSERMAKALDVVAERCKRVPSLAHPVEDGADGTAQAACRDGRNPRRRDDLRE